MEAGRTVGTRTIVDVLDATATLYDATATGQRALYLFD